MYGFEMLLVQEEEDKREQARDELAAMGDEIIDQLVEIYNDNRYKMHIAIVLKKIGSQKGVRSTYLKSVIRYFFNISISK